MISPEMFDVDNRVKQYLAHAIYDSGRVADTMVILRSLIQAKFAFQHSDRMLIINVWASIINSHRTALLNIVSDENSPLITNKLVTPLKEKALALVNEVISAITDLFMPNVTEDESRLVYLKHLADFQRYKLEFMDKTDKETLMRSAKANYERIIESTRTTQTQHAELIASTYLNMSILVGDHMEDPTAAIDLLTPVKREYSVTLDKYPDDIKAKINEFMQLMDENIARWKELVPPPAAESPSQS